MFAIPPGPGRAERACLGLFLLLLLGLYVWAAHFRLDALDEGYFMSTSWRVLAGDLPYRDFSTPYTPAFFYLNALLFRIFGLDLLTLRSSLIVARLGLLLLIYLLGRRIMPPAFAVLPLVVMLVEDQAPSVWESHPSWWATLALLAAVWCVCCIRERGHTGWWIVAGLAAGISFAFKQNLGLFALAALVGVALLEPRTLPPTPAPAWLRRLAERCPPKPAERLLQRAGPGYLLALCLGSVWGMRFHLDSLLLITFAAPFGALAVEQLQARGCHAAGPADRCVAQRLAAMVARLGLLGAAFAAVTLPWLVALTLALGPRATPFSAFLGAIDSGGYYLAMDPPRVQLMPVLGMVALAPVAAWALLGPRPRWLRLGVGLGAMALAAGCVQELLRPAPEVEPRTLRAIALLSIQAMTNLILYLPSVAFWTVCGLLWLGRSPACLRFTLRWYLLAGSLLLLNQYPRMDETHILFSGPLLWIVGSYGLWRLFAAATRRVGPGPNKRVGRAAMYVALLGLPLAALWPTLELRREDLLVRQSGALLNLATPHYVPLDLPGASVEEIDTIAWKFRTLAAYLREHSRPGERIFVYPAAPLIYYLVDRPNATRFNHVFPGLLSEADEQETIERLGSIPATFVIWDSFGAEYWGQPGIYQRLTDYIWDNYDPVESIGGFEVMRRKAG